MAAQQKSIKQRTFPLCDQTPEHDSLIYLLLSFGIGIILFILLLSCFFLFNAISRFSHCSGFIEWNFWFILYIQCDASLLFTL
jgi:hypothetical protein